MSGRFKQAAPWCALAVACFCCSLGLNLIFSGDGQLGYWRVISYILLVPLLEELLFRRFVYKLLRRRMDAPRAEIIDSVLFGLWHFPSPVTMVYGFLMGRLFCRAYEKTGKLDAPYLLHMSANAGAMVRSLFLLRFSGLPAAVIGLVVCVFSAAYLFRACKNI